MAPIIQRSKLMKPSFDEPAAQSARYAGARGKQRKAGAGFSPKSYGSGHGRSASLPSQQPPFVLPAGVLSVRASSQKLASRIAGYSRAAAGNDSVRQALMDMLSSDWTSPEATTVHARGSRADTAPAASTIKPHGLPPIANHSGGATLICDPHANGAAHGADPPHWSRSAKAPIPLAMAATKPFGGESRHKSNHSAFALGPGEIEMQVAAIAQRIRATRPSQEPTHLLSEGMSAPTPPRQSRHAQPVPITVPPSGDSARTIVSKQKLLMGCPRVAETSEDRARAAVSSLTNRYTVRIGTAAENAQIIGRADPTWTAAQIQRYSNHPGASAVAKSDGRRPRWPSRRTAALPRLKPAQNHSSVQNKSGTTSGKATETAVVPVREANTTATAAVHVREVKTKAATRQQDATDAHSAADVWTNPSTTCVVGKTKEKTPRFAGFSEHDMEEESGLTGWGQMEE